MDGPGITGRIDEDESMIISTCGFGNTGASAVLDFLQGYPGLQRISDFEFQLFHMADGVNDLKYQLVFNRERIACNSAIKRFRRAALHGRVGQMMKKLCGDAYVKLTNEYIDRLIQVSWMGYSRYDPSDVSNRVQEGLRSVVQTDINRLFRRISHRFHYPRYQVRYLAMMDEARFDALTRAYFEDCVRVVGLNPDEDILTDVLFSAMNPRAGTEFVRDPKIIIVQRDPRDMFIRATENQATNGHTPCRDVEPFIAYYRTLMTNMIPCEDALTVQYEDLIYDYYPTTRRIMDYLGYANRPAEEFRFFNPDASVKYTKAWITYPGHDREKEAIENALGEYLYPFPEYMSVEAQRARYEGAAK